MKQDLISSKVKIAQITSQHKYTDARIREKECFSLANAGYDVILVAPDAPDTKENNLIIVGFPKPKGRLMRITVGLWRLYKKTISLKPDIVHFHDPDVILIGLILKMHGIKVIFDVHENFPNLAYDRQWVPLLAKWPLSAILSVLMKLSGLIFDGIVAATPSIKELFPNSKTVVVKNMSRLDIFNDIEKLPSSYPSKICYVGGMSEARGFIQMLDAINIVNKDLECQLILAGVIPTKLKEKTKDNPGWNYSKQLGFLTRAEVSQLYAKCDAGLVVLAPSKNHIESLPIKMFEYMAAQLPVIASDFPIWEQLIVENECGVCVNPYNTQQIADAIIMLINSPAKAKKMGLRGKYFAETKYNWALEEEKLLEFYSKIILNN
jgi:glycosyltransferase involved in cell wall biosynthesis